MKVNLSNGIDSKKLGSQLKSTIIETMIYKTHSPKL